MELEARKLEEKEFHDKLRTVDADPHVADTRWSPAMEETIETNPMWVNMKYYSIERTSRELVLDTFRRDCPGKEVLDYCCGNGEDSMFIAQQGAKRVTGIDISDISVENCGNLAKRNGPSNTHFQVADAENTGFDDDSFDFITEYGALHHLDLPKAYREMARILRPDGKIICNEVLAHNPLIHGYRRLTPKLRTPWEVEHILRRKDFNIAREYFGKVELHFFHLSTLLAVPFRKTFLFSPMLSLMEAIDSVVLKVPGLKWQAWQVVFTMSEPKKELLQGQPTEREQRKAA